MARGKRYGFKSRASGVAGMPVLYLTPRALRYRFSALDHALEVAEILIDARAGVSTEKRRDSVTSAASGRVVLQRHAHLGAAAARPGLEPHGARVIDVAARRAPRDELAGNFVDDLGVPFHANAARPARDPVRMSRITH